MCTLNVEVNNPEMTVFAKKRLRVVIVGYVFFKGCNNGCLLKDFGYSAGITLDVFRRETTTYT